MCSGNIASGITVGGGKCPQLLAAMTQFGLFWGGGLDRETTTDEIGIMQEVTREAAPLGGLAQVLLLALLTVQQSSSAVLNCCV
jgi:hypothetical protein